MEMQEIIKQAEQNIKQALKDYGAHTNMTEVLNDVSDTFIRQLAKDSSYAKRGLRGLFSKSPVWDEKIDALVINGTRTHDPDYRRIRNLAYEILYPAIAREGLGSEVYNKIYSAIGFFANPDEAYKVDSIEAIKELAPKAYTPTKKPSRVFKALCVALGVADETAGSDFQRLFAQFADELTAKKIGFKLYVSINPAHFLTMSNPKGDQRGTMLTSCHSFNSTEHRYNNGCSGYARDEVSFIVFTVADPSDPETLNNRKTTRQVFAYSPGSGLLMQSRMYNTSGGTYEAQADSKLYRDLVQREISMLENVPNLWKTVSSTGDKAEWVEEGKGFGGYADWTYGDFDGHISFRTDFDKDCCEPLWVGTYGLCICCGDEINEGLYCEECKYDRYICDDCGEHYNELNTAYDSNGNEVHVCDSCLDDEYQYCEVCGRYYVNDRMNYVDKKNICDDCLSEYYEQCEDCGCWFKKEDTYTVYDRDGCEVQVCEGCLNGYTLCNECDEYHAHENMVELIRADGERENVCYNCARDYTKCPHCGGWVETCDDGICPNCGEAVEEEEKEETA